MNVNKTKIPKDFFEIEKFLEKIPNHPQNLISFILISCGLRVAYSVYIIDVYQYVRAVNLGSSQYKWESYHQQIISQFVCL